MDGPLIRIGAPTSEIETGTYGLRLKALSAKTITVEGEERDVYEWMFTLLDSPDPDEPIECSGLTSQSTGPKSKTVSFLAALIGPEALSPGAELNAEDVVGKIALGNIGPNKNGWPRVETLVAMPKAMRAAYAVSKPEIADAGPVPADEETASAAPTPAKPKTKAVSPIREKVEDPSVDSSDGSDDLPF